ncbi:MAG TPA: methyltransferase domain-containing protein [Vicinamibacteria bacterium]|nr:methyltransferase domain-containing protein [Vicinamibacteria bacterium]
MISAALLDRAACPTCLEANGCARCTRPAGHAPCADYADRAGCPCGGPDKVRLRPDGAQLLCPCCGGAYRFSPEGDYADLLPRSAVGETTHYAEHEFHERLGVREGEPLLSARVKADMMLRMLDPQPEGVLLDLGCGAAKLTLFARRSGAKPVGVDAAPFFLARARGEVDLAVADLRRLPFRKAAFPRAFSLDVLEHLDAEGLRETLIEARRTVGPGGRLFVYTHAMESSRLARFQRGVNRVAERLGRAGLIDVERERLRKSDHKNAIRSHEHFEAVCAEAGLRVVERRYYNVVFKPLVEDLLLRLYERRRQKATRAHAATSPAAPAAPRRSTIALGRALTWLLKLDVVLFGGIRTGPFFGLLEAER